MRITKRILPKGRKYGRPGYRLKTPSYITVHNTGNESSGADALAHARYLEAGHAISWHFTVDAYRVVQHLPTWEQGWHTGTQEGNQHSIGVEVCEYPNTAKGRKLQRKAEARAERLIAYLRHRKNIPAGGVRTHKSWSGKNCPRDILPHWAAFRHAVIANYDAAYRAYPGKLVKGDTGVDVRWVQNRLNEAGYPVRVDSTYGQKTAEAVKAFRTKQFGPGQTGTTGRITWAKLARKL